MTIPQKILQIQIQVLAKAYPDAQCALHFHTPFQLLVATILSAQCTDKMVNKITEKLFQLYPDAASLAHCPAPRLEELIKSSGFYRNKAKNILSVSKILDEKYQGEVPKDMEILIHLPGVGRKTANVVLNNAYGIASGIVVDTHVMRITQRLKWTEEHVADRIETDLKQKIPQKYWIMVAHWLIHHGRTICKAQRPDYTHCPLEKYCCQFSKNKKLS